MQTISHTVKIAEDTANMSFPSELLREENSKGKQMVVCKHDCLLATEDDLATIEAVQDLDAALRRMYGEKVGIVTLVNAAAKLEVSGLVRSKYAVRKGNEKDAAMLWIVQHPEHLQTVQAAENPIAAMIELYREHGEE